MRCSTCAKSVDTVQFRSTITSRVTTLRAGARTGLTPGVTCNHSRSSLLILETFVKQIHRNFHVKHFFCINQTMDFWNCIWERLNMSCHLLPNIFDICIRCDYTIKQMNLWKQMYQYLFLAMHFSKKINDEKIVYS